MTHYVTFPFHGPDRFQRALYFAIRSRSMCCSRYSIRYAFNGWIYIFSTCPRNSVGTLFVRCSAFVPNFVRLVVDNNNEKKTFLTSSDLFTSIALEIRQRSRIRQYSRPGRLRETYPDDVIIEDFSRINGSPCSKRVNRGRNCHVRLRWPISNSRVSNTERWLSSPYILCVSRRETFGFGYISGEKN